MKSLLGYIKAIFNEDKLRFCVLKAGGPAIEKAMKVAQMAQEDFGNLHSIFKPMLYCEDFSKKNTE